MKKSDAIVPMCGMCGAGTPFRRGTSPVPPVAIMSDPSSHPAEKQSLPEQTAPVAEPESL